MKAKYIIGVVLVFLSLTPAWSRQPDNWPKSKGGESMKSRAAECLPATQSAELAFNNVNARLYNNGRLWYDKANGRGIYEVPKGSNTHPIFAGALWIGGRSPNGTLKMAATTYSQNGGENFWPGPLTVDGAASAEADVCNEYDRFYSAFRADAARQKGYNIAVNEGTADSEYPGYAYPSYFDEWPGNNRTANYDPVLAPFVDNPFSETGLPNVYEPEKGDYPGYDLSGEVNCRNATRDVPLFGDTTIYWIMNDKGNIHQDPATDPIGLELRVQAFSFADEGPINNMTFYNYVIINQGGQVLESTYFGQWLDVDLGFSDDDYVGCDVQRGLGFVYNGDEDDNVTGGASQGYGLNPPAFGVDFFQGPFQDRDIDSSSIPWDFLADNYGILKGDNPGPFHEEFAPLGIPEDSLDYDLATLGKGIPYRGIGIGYGDSIPDNERFGMRKFLFYDRGTADNQDPFTQEHYYNYLQGVWKDGTPFYYGGNAYNNGVDRSIRADFMFPGSSDPVGFGTRGNTDAPFWDEASTGNTPFDRRFLQSAGPFTLEPGDINNVTVGLVWARAETGGVQASITKMKEADDIAQGLFDDCFQVFEGPDAPIINITELDRQLVLTLENPATSNNVNESYDVIKRDIPKESRFETSNVWTVNANGDTVYTNGSVTVVENDVSYNFEGYRIYQLKDGTVGPSDLDDVTLAKEIFQVDIENYYDNGEEIATLINYEVDPETGVVNPVIEVEGNNAGIQKTFLVTEDKFATGSDKKLVNNKTYYFMAVAYAHNNYQEYNTETFEGQSEQYVGSRKNGFGGSISAVGGIPHKLEAQNGGTKINANYGDELAVTRLEGVGNSGNFVVLSKESEEAILNSPDMYVDELTYEEGGAPISIKVIDPLNLVADEYTLEITGTYRNNENQAPSNDSLTWKLYGTMVNESTGYPDTIYSVQAIDIGGEQVILDLGISVDIKNVTPEELGATMDANDTRVVGAKVTYENAFIDWLTWLGDRDEESPYNWIRAGQLISDEFPDINFPDYEVFNKQGGQTADWEKLLNGGWAPMVFLDDTLAGFRNPRLTAPNQGYGVFGSGGKVNASYMPNVDVVFTSDRSKWTRVPVIEAAFQDLLSEGDAQRGQLRDAASVDKFGNPVRPEDFGVTSLDQVPVSMNENDPNFISPKGMGWFPGYAIDVLTGERLNMGFTEDSFFKSNGNDMIWNPSSRETVDRVNPESAVSYIFGGKHMIIVFKNQARVMEAQSFKNNRSTPEHDDADINDDYVGAYDYGQKAIEGLSRTSGNPKFFKAVVESMGWVGYPMVKEKFENTDTYFEIPTETRVQLRVSKRFEPYHAGNDYSKTLADGAYVSANSQNNFEPLYKFSTQGKAPEFNLTQVVKDNLPNIRVVPNPYYAFSDNDYETNRLDNRVRITNLPREVKVSIYTIEGTLIRTFSKNNDSDSYIEWDLKNDANIPISSGIYYIHVDAPGVGEQVVKWMGFMRKVDLENL